MSRLRRRGLIREGMSADEIAEAVAQAKVSADVEKEAQRLQNAQAAQQVRVAHPQY
jgi:hypothetical protein